MTRGLARDLGDSGITANLVQPGPIDTKRNPANGPNAAANRIPLAIPRHGTPDEVASLVAYRASADAGFITGATINIDGGWSAWRGGRYRFIDKCLHADLSHGGSVLSDARRPRPTYRHSPPICRFPKSAIHSRRLWLIQAIGKSQLNSKIGFDTDGGEAGTLIGGREWDSRVTLRLRQCRR